MGEKACPETINPTSFGGTADRFGAGYGALDLSGEEYSHKGNNSTVCSKGNKEERANLFIFLGLKLTGISMVLLFL